MPTQAKYLVRGMSVPEKRAYNAWASARQRVINRRDKAWKYYGERGITMDPRWIESFYAFVEDMGYSPTGLTLERVDNDGNYCKANCKWATRAEQNRNKRAKA